MGRISPPPLSKPIRTLATPRKAGDDGPPVLCDGDFQLYAGVTDDFRTLGQLRPRWRKRI